MKTLFAFLLAVVSVQAFAFTPTCVAIGTRSEGWQMPNGQIKFDNCRNKIAFCGAKGTRSEGWYAAEVSDQKLLGWDNCSEDQSRKPACVNVGTRSEGWQAPGGKLIWDKCSQKAVLCSAIGTRSEGWYAGSYNEGTAVLLGWDNCAQ